MGTYVNQISISGTALPDVLPESPGTNFDGNVDPSAPWTIVENKFTSAAEITTDLLALVTGTGGYMDELADSIEAYPTADINDIIYTEILPDDIEAAFSWYETAFNNDFYDAIKAKLTTDLVNGSSGIGGTVEQDIYDRAVARKELEEVRIYDELEERLSSTGFDLPTGAMTSALQEHGNAVAMRTQDINLKIIEEQADLAQKNSQFVITASTNLDNILRDFIGKLNQRSLDYKKALADHIIKAYDLYLKDAGNVLLAQTSKADNSVKGYAAEYGLKVEVAKALVAAGMQGIASALGATNASAGLNYSGSDSRGETWNHGESKSHQTSVSLSGQVSASVSNTLQESHEFKS